MDTHHRDITLPYLRFWREKYFLTQTELGKKAGVAYATISRIENGAGAKMNTIAKLATALGITREQLIRTNPAEEKPTERRAVA